MPSILAPARNRSVLVLGALVAALLALYLLAIDQGQMLALVQGDIAYAQNLLHESVHDARHAGGFPCH